MEEHQLELADSLAEAQRNHGIEMARKQMEQEKDPNFDGVNCVDCDEPIAPERLALKRIRCTLCATAIEKRARFYRG